MIILSVMILMMRIIIIIIKVIIKAGLLIWKYIIITYNNMIYILR